MFVLLLLACNNYQSDKLNFVKKEYATIIEASLKDKLIPITNDGEFKFGVRCAFINNLGDTIIPFGKFSAFETDTLVTFTIVKDEKNGVVGINRKGEVLFDAFIYGDVQLDSYAEGLVRILQNEKIGFADETGKIVIKPNYKCAYPFINGRAKVAYECKDVKDGLEHSNWESESWFYINKKGEKIK